MQSELAIKPEVKELKFQGNKRAVLKAAGAEINQDHSQFLAIVNQIISTKEPVRASNKSQAESNLEPTGTLKQYPSKAGGSKNTGLPEPIGLYPAKALEKTKSSKPLSTGENPAESKNRLASISLKISNIDTKKSRFFLAGRGRIPDQTRLLKPKLHLEKKIENDISQGSRTSICSNKLYVQSTLLNNGIRSSNFKGSSNDISTVNQKSQTRYSDALRNPSDFEQITDNLDQVRARPMQVKAEEKPLGTYKITGDVIPDLINRGHNYNRQPMEKQASGRSNIEGKQGENQQILELKGSDSSPKWLSGKEELGRGLAGARHLENEVLAFYRRDKAVKKESNELDKIGIDAAASIEKSACNSGEYLTLKVPADAKPLAQPAILSNVMAKLVDQIKLTGRGKQSSIKLQLKPEYLGNLKILIQSVEGQVSVLFTADNPETVNLLTSGLQQIRENLEQQGIKLGNLEVGLADKGNEGGNSSRNEEEKSNPSPPAIKSQADLIDIAEAKNKGQYKINYLA